MLPEGRYVNILLLLIPAALFLGGLGLAGFIWALKNNQFDDLEGAAARILLDDDDDDDDNHGKP